MSPHVIDLRSADDSRDVVHRAVQALAEGKIVGFPTETVYNLAASGLSEDAVSKLMELSRTKGDPAPEASPGDRHELILAVKSADEALDYVPNLCSLGSRLARRCWPGPVTLVVEDHHPESLIKQLPPAVQQIVAPAGTIGMRVPAHRVLQDVLRLLAGPIVVMNAQQRDRTDAVTAQEVVENWDNQVQLVLDDGRCRFGQPSSVVRITHEQYRVLQVGVVSEQTLKRLASMIVLFVCTGNTCRSPMAEAMFRHRLAQKLGCNADALEDRGVIIMSAGIAAMMGGRPSAESVDVMAEMGIDLLGHQSQPLTEQLVRHADLIITMTRSHREAILSEWPEAADRTKLLSHDERDVADPVGGPIDLYRRCAAQITEELESWLKEINV
jgi:tRNA threonylcarbamoyl adenosine modification protein (Sua5/YciO/YrdC/YwlC family)